MNNIDADRTIYAFTGKTKYEYLEGIIEAWSTYLAVGGDPDKYVPVSELNKTTA